MASKRKKMFPLRKERTITIPLSALKCLSHYPKEKKMICEINFSNLQKHNTQETLEEMLEKASLDYILGDFESFEQAEEAIKYLKK